MNYGKEDYAAMARKRKLAFQNIAKELGKDHPITKMMGSLSYGRHRAEHGPEYGLREAVREMAFLDGYFDCLNLWARDNDDKVQRVMLRLYPTGFSRDGE